MTPGWWTPRRRINREVSVPGGWQRLSRAGTIGNLEVAAGRADGPYAGGFPFLDSDVYKWLEAVGWTFADPDLPESVRTVLEAHVNELVDLLAAAQEPDGYLDSWFQVKFPGERFAQLEWGHELYCAGHLIQAAIAHHRSVGDDRLLAIARRFADLIVASFGPGEGRNDRICGHAEIETALVELSRTTGQDAYLRTAARFIDRHGAGTLVPGSHGAKYFQDHEPLRQADQVAGHAVRQLYLLSGAADVAAETGDVGLLDACARLWADMAGTKTYLTGGVGAHHADEAFGDPYELPPERAYSETCAAIASILLGSRLLLATGEARYADLVERTLYNAFLAGTSTDGQSYAYANPLAVRAGHLSDGSDQDPSRQEWFDCACCPPNVMRLIASLEHYAVAGADDAVYVHQYLAGRWEVDVTGGTVVVAVDTHYPADETILIRVVETPETPWTLALRVPGWARGARTTLTGVTTHGVTEDSDVAPGWWRAERRWRAGDEVVLTLPLRPRVTVADPRVDAVRGCIALERGPLVYCVEGVDQPGVRLDDLVVDAEGWEERPLAWLPGAVGLRGTARVPARPVAGWWPYSDAGVPGPTDGERVAVVAVPYFAWGNREPGEMRVWLRSGG